MHRNVGESMTLYLGQIVTAACDLGGTIAADRAVATELAARHLERVLVRGRNARIAAALAELANELAPLQARYAQRSSAAPMPRAA
jgi:hypothetical protein